MSEEQKQAPIDYSLVDLKKEKTDFVIFHGGCCDGFSSAYSVWKYFQKNSLDEQLEKITFYPARHGASPPDVSGKNVVICDFSYDKSTLLNMIEKANSLVVLDHHKSAEKELAEIPEKIKYSEWTTVVLLLLGNSFSQMNRYPNSFNTLRTGIFGRKK